MVVGDVTTAVDVLVLGAGPGGYVAAIRAAQLGKHVTLVDRGPAGGTCLLRGCIPLKALLASSERYSLLRQSDLQVLGIQAETVSFDWGKMQAWKQSVVERLTEGVRRLLQGHKIEYVQGNGWFMNGREVRVEGEHGSHRFKFEQCILATGAEAIPLEAWPYDLKKVFTPEQALSWPELPPAVNLIGEDYITLELASVFARLGLGVKVFTSGEQILPGVDTSALRMVQVALRKQGIQFVTNAVLTNRELPLLDGPVIVSNGMRARTEGLHLDALNLKLASSGRIEVNSMQQTSNSRVYAVGDCCSASEGQQLASLAIKQGKVAAEVIAGQRVQFAPLVTPRVILTTPELATAGYSPEEARKAGYEVKVGRFPLAANGRALTLGSETGVAQLVANAEDGVLLGATLVGPRAGDLIGQVVLAIEMGATLTDLAEILYAHPGLGETLQESAEAALGHAIHVLTKV